MLKAMSASPGDPQPVFDLIARQAREPVQRADGCGLSTFDGTLIHLRAAAAASPQCREPMRDSFRCGRRGRHLDGRAHPGPQIVHHPGYRRA